MEQYYTAEKRFMFGKTATYIEKGDLLKSDPANKDSLAVFRGDKLVLVTSTTQLSLEAWIRSGFVQKVVQSAASAQPTAPAQPATPAQPAPEQHLYEIIHNGVRVRPDELHPDAPCWLVNATSATTIAALKVGYVVADGNEDTPQGAWVKSVTTKNNRATIVTESVSVPATPKAEAEEPKLVEEPKEEAEEPKLVEEPKEEAAAEEAKAEVEKPSEEDPTEEAAAPEEKSVEPTEIATGGTPASEAEAIALLREKSRQQLVDHAKEVHGLDLDKSVSKSKLIDAITSAAASK
jgi:hypothetical protein